MNVPTSPRCLTLVGIEPGQCLQRLISLPCVLDREEEESVDIITLGHSAHKHQKPLCNSLIQRQGGYSLSGKNTIASKVTWSRAYLG